MAVSDAEDLPVFLEWQCPTQGDTHFFVRSDWVMEFLVAHLPQEDALRVWAKMHAERVRTNQGKEAADEFLSFVGAVEH